MDQVTLAQVVLSVAIKDGMVALQEQDQDIEQAMLQLRDIESLPGRDRENALFQYWINGPDDVESKAFYQHVVLMPMKRLAAFTKRIMDSLSSS